MWFSYVAHFVAVVLCWLSSYYKNQKFLCDFYFANFLYLNYTCLCLYNTIMTWLIINRSLCLHMSRLMGKPTICIYENKDADQLISAFVFATRIVQFLFYLNPKFQASSSFLCLNRPVCVRPVRKPHCWFSHEKAHMIHY